MNLTILVLLFTMSTHEFCAFCEIFVTNVRKLHSIDTVRTLKATFIELYRVTQSYSLSKPLSPTYTADATQLSNFSILLTWWMERKLIPYLVSHLHH